MIELPDGFDPLVYLALNPDVAASGMDAGLHYLEHGARENRVWKRLDRTTLPRVEGVGVYVAGLPGGACDPSGVEALPQMMWQVFENAALVPEGWSGEPGLINVFNNAVFESNGRRIMAYRVVTSSGRRRIALCRLGADWRLEPGSVVAFSDHLVYADGGDPAADLLEADARIFEVEGRLYLHFNNGSPDSGNRIYLVAFDPDSLLPMGAVREVVLAGARRGIEKNWIFFSAGGQAYAVYGFAPLVILRVDLSDPQVVRCERAFVHEWDALAYEHSYGEIRGGATPVVRDGRLFFVAHSVFSANSATLGYTEADLCYVGLVVVLEAVAPFAPVMASLRPMLEASPREMALPHEHRLDPRCVEDVYPCGAVVEGDDLVVSYGVHNRYSVLRRISFKVLDAALMPALRHVVLPEVADGVARECDPISELNAYWWQPVGISPRDPNADKRVTGGNFIHGNFGDMMVPHLLGRLTGARVRNADGDGPRLFTLGSLVSLLGEGDVVWGTGVNGSAPEIYKQPKHLHVLATRGPITLEFLRTRGYDIRRVDRFFDPGCLIGSLFAAEIATLKQQGTRAGLPFLIIPHFRDDLVMRKMYAEHAHHIRSVDTPFFELVRDILHTELVISSSLHGVIIAEALGVPAVWHAPVMGENELKFTDYYLGTDRWNIVRHDSLAGALRATPMPIPRFDTAGIAASFPTSAELRALGVMVPVADRD